MEIISEEPEIRFCLFLVRGYIARRAPGFTLWVSEIQPMFEPAPRGVDESSNGLPRNRGLSGDRVASWPSSNLAFSIFILPSTLRTRAACFPFLLASVLPFSRTLVTFPELTLAFSGCRAPGRNSSTIPRLLTAFAHCFLTGKPTEDYLERSAPHLRSPR